MDNGNNSDSCVPSECPRDEDFRELFQRTNDLITALAERKGEKNLIHRLMTWVIPLAAVLLTIAVPIAFGWQWSTQSRLTAVETKENAFEAENARQNNEIAASASSQTVNAERLGRIETTLTYINQSLERISRKMEAPGNGRQP